MYLFFISIFSYNYVLILYQCIIFYIISKLFELFQIVRNITIYLINKISNKREILKRHL